MLIDGFNTFLPAGYRIECAADVPRFNYIFITTPWGETARLSRTADDEPLSGQSLASSPSLSDITELSETCSLSPSSDSLDLELEDSSPLAEDDVSLGHSSASSSALSIAETLEDTSGIPVSHHGALSAEERCEKCKLKRAASPC